MDAEHHDMVLAITSHVPHLIAYNIVNTARHLERVTDTEVIKFSAGGFRDFTRIAASDPVMWRDVFLNNKEAVLEMLGRFSEDLTALQRAIRFGDGDTLHKLFVEARAIRRGIIEAGQDTAAPDFGRHGTGCTDASAAAQAPRMHDADAARSVGVRLRVADVAAGLSPTRRRGTRGSPATAAASASTRCIIAARPERPGLVLGLDRGGACEGIAYRVRAANAAADHRAICARASRSTASTARRMCPSS